jgi:hypothetical protein
MAAPSQGLPVRLERAPHRGAAFALSNASKRARARSVVLRSGSLFIGSRSKGSSFIFPTRYLIARDHGLSAVRHVHLLMNVFHRDVLISPRSLALKREQALLKGG